MFINSKCVPVERLSLMQGATMQVLFLLPLLLLLPVAILIVRRRRLALSLTPPPIKFKAHLSTLKSAIARARSKPIIFITDFSTAHHLLVQGSRPSSSTTTTSTTTGSFSNRPPSMAPSAVLSGRRYHNINSAPHGPFWRTLRRNLTAGILHPTHLHGGAFTAARRRALRRLVADLMTSGGGGVVLSVAAAESIRRAMFGLASAMCFGGGDDDGLDAGVVNAMAGVQAELVRALSTVRTFVFAPCLAVSKLLYRARWRKLAAIRRRQEELYLPLIAARRRRRHCRRDDDSDDETLSYVDTLVDLQVPVDGGGGEQRRRLLEDGELVGLCSEFLGSGTESVAAALQWILGNLMRRPELQEAVRREIDAAVDDDDAEEVEEEVLGKLDGLNAVVLEALRLHPTIKMVFRQVMEEDQVVHDGHRVPAGTKMLFPLQDLARDKTVWDDPDEFMPERFHGCGGAGESTKKLLSMAAEMKMMPFGAGRRMCPAISVSLLHITYFAANLLREFEWREAEGDEHAVQLHSDAVIEMFNFMKRPLRAHLVIRRSSEGKKIR